jgi:radical SAM protein with 4Fe4S-binding SPASM domain
LEGDSARVWDTLYKGRGSTNEAWNYILKQGVFDGDPTSEAKEVLSSFLVQLSERRLIVLPGRDYQPLLPPAPNERTVVERAGAEASISQNVAQRLSDHHILYSLIAELTYRCNEACVHCYVPDGKKSPELSSENWFRLLDEFEELGGFHLQLTGGELFTRNDVSSILRELATRNFVVSITSNLTLLDEPMADLIQQLYPKSVGCSLYASVADLHDAVTCHPGSFDLSVSAIKMLRSRGVPVVIKSPLMARTIGEWRALEALARTLSCEIQFDVNITAQNNGGTRPLELRATDEEALEDLFSSRFYKLYLGDEPLWSLRGPSPDALLCGAGASGLAIGPDGDVRPCLGLNISLGRWPEKTMREIWNHSPFFEEWPRHRLTDIPECAGCEKFRFCVRCPGAWHAEHGSYLKPNAYTCFLADVWSRVCAGTGHKMDPSIAESRKKGGD